MKYPGEFLRGLGWFGMIRLAFYPITALITTPIRLIQTFWASRVLFDGRWGNYPHFSPHTALNHLFYHTAAINLYRFGRAGRSPYLGLGDYRLSKFFQYSLPSLYAFWIASAPTVLTGLVGWWLTHLIWLRGADEWAVWAVLGLALVSTIFYVNLARQNYNVIGWLFFPLGLYGLMTMNWIVAGSAWMLAQLGSFTVGFMGGILSLIASFVYWTPAPIVAFLPAAVLWSSHFWPLMIHNDLSKTVSEIAKAIGLMERKAAYKRSDSKGFDLRAVYFSILYGQFILVVYLLRGEIPLLFLGGVIVFLINSILFRFADPQSMHMMMLSLGIGTTILQFHPLLLISYWVLISPLPKSLMFPVPEPVVDTVPLLSPFDIGPLVDDMQNFLSSVQKGQRVLMAFEDPGGIYENIFDGYRVLLELPLYISAQKEIHFMPDWWAVSGTNYEGAPNIWGRDVEAVLENVQRWKADFVVVYQNAETELASVWQESGFVPLSKYSWSNRGKELENLRLGRNKTLPDWWLLKVPTFNTLSEHLPTKPHADPDK